MEHKAQEIAKEIIRTSQSMLLVRMRFLDVAIFQLDDLDRFTIAQISSFIDICNENKCVNCLAALLDQKNKMLDGEAIDVMNEFTLED